jgi:hypothetical protein
MNFFRTLKDIFRDPPPPPRPSITHLACGRESFHPNDIEFKFCGYCHRFLHYPHEYRINNPRSPYDGQHF